MVRALLEMKVRAGDESRFEAAWREVARVAAAAPGNLRQALLRDPDDTTRYLISTDWESLDAFRNFERSPAQDQLTAPLRALRVSAQMSLFEIRSIFDGTRELA